MARKRQTDFPGNEGPPPSDTNGNGPINENGAGEKKRPVQSYRVHSDRTTSIELAIWSNEVDYGDGNKGVQYSTTINRSYKGNDGWERQKHPSFRAHDIVVLQFLLRKAHDWMLQQRVVEDTPVA